MKAFFVLQIKTLKWYAFIPLAGYAIWVNKTDDEKQLAIVFAYHLGTVALMLHYFLQFLG